MKSLVLTMLLLTVIGCGSSGTRAADEDSAAASRAQGGERTGESGSVVGAWYSDTLPYGADEELCLVLCENGRYFDGDRKCSDTTASDFDCYHPYDVNGSEVVVEGEMTLMAVTASEDQLSFSIAEDGSSFDITLQRVADDPGLCEEDRPQCAD